MGLTAQETTAGVFTLTIPSAVLPTTEASATIVATMRRGGLEGKAFVTVNLNAPPFCTLSSTDPSKCFKLDLVASTFPTAVATLSATGWSDYVDGTTLTYEFGTREGSNLNVQQSGSTLSAIVLGLKPGNRTLYGCISDTQGAQVCAVVEAQINDPGADFNAESTISGFNVTSLKAASRSIDVP